MRRNVMLAAFAAVVLVLLLSFPASASGPCAGGRCAAGRAARATTATTARVATRIVTAPVRVTRHALKR